MKKYAGPLVLSMLVICGWAIADEGTIQVSTTDAMKAAVTKVQPDYPSVAKQLGIRGDVIVKAVIGESGSVESAKAETGNPVLLNAALEATKRWKFTPFTDASGKSVKAITELKFSFRVE